MSRAPSAVVIRCTRLNGGGWSAVVRIDGKADKAFVTVADNYPEGTRLYLVDGTWVKR